MKNKFKAMCIPIRYLYNKHETICSQINFSRIIMTAFIWLFVVLGSIALAKAIQALLQYMENQDKKRLEALKLKGLFVDL